MLSADSADEPLQLPGNDSALDYIFRTKRESVATGSGDLSTKRVARATWAPCVADADSLDDLDFGACIDAVSGRCSTLVGARGAAEVMLRPVSDRELIDARMRDVRLLSAARSNPRTARSATGASLAQKGAALAQKGAGLAQNGAGLAQNGAGLAQNGATQQKDGDTRRTARELLGAAAGAESKALWCSVSPDDMDHDVREALTEPYFRGGPHFLCRVLNSCWPLLYGCGTYNAYAVPVMAMASPIIYLLTPFFIIRWKMNLPITPGMYVRVMYHAMMGSASSLSFTMGTPLASVLQLASLAATAIMYAQGVASTLRSSKRLREVSARISEGAAAAHAVVSSAAMLSEEVASVCGPGFLDRWLPPDLEDHPSAVGASGWDIGAVPSPAPLWNSDSAVALAWFTRMDRAALRSAFLVLAAVDLVLALGSLLNRSGAGPRGRTPMFCQPELLDSRASPLIAVSAGWCPGLGGNSQADDAASDSGVSGSPEDEGWHTTVPNDVALAWPLRRGILVTGANATGKSTALRVLGCCSLMAQTVGIAPARAMALTPLLYVCTMMRVRDSPERGLSRFQAELMRAGHCMDSASEGSGQGRGGLVLLDEVFAGSSDPRSSDACGVRVLEVLSGSPGALVALSTHQESLADWAEKRRGFASFMTEPSGYKLVKGRNSTSNAVEQMRKFRRQTVPP
jgi:hypothetical protein